MSKNQNGNQPDYDSPSSRPSQIVSSDCERCHRNIAVVNMRYGYVYCRVIFDEEGRPVDFIHEEANAAYCKMTGIKNIEGLKVSEVFPGFLDSNPGFMERHLNVAETGVPDNFELYLESLGRWFDFAVISSEKEYFTAIIDDVTDRKLAEAVLKENEGRFRAFFENHSAIKMLLDAENGNIVDANYAAAEFYGYSVDALRKMNIQQISTVKNEILKTNLEKMRTSQQKIFAFTHIRSDGSLRNVELFTNKIEIRGKDLLYHIIHDVTERKQAEEALLKSEERFRKLFESYSAIQLVIDPDTGAIIDANPAAADYYGWSIDELRQMHIQDINTRQSESLKKEFQTVTSAHKSKYLFRHRRADGSIRDVEVFSTRVEIDGKELLYSIINDITDRIETELALKQSEERFRSLFEDHAAVMIVLDPETGSIVDANQAAADFYGWSIDKIRTMNINAVNTSSAETIREEMDKWHKMEQRSMAFRHRRADGSIRDVEIFAKKIRIMGRDLVYDIVHDVTLRKRLEQVNEFRLQILKKADSLSVDELLQESVDEAERLTGSEIGFVFFVDEDQKTLLLQVVSSNTFQHMCKAEGKGKHYPLDEAGVWADAVRDRKVVIHNDYASLKNRKGMPQGHAEIRREMVVPIIRDERIVAIMGIGNKPTDYDDNDVEWVEALANQVWDIVAKKIAEEQEKVLQGQLQLSKKMEMIGQLAAGLAHEINNPVNFITINAANLENNFDDVRELVGSYRRIIDKIEAGSEVGDDVRELREKERSLEVDVLLKEIPETLAESQKGVERITTIIRSLRNYSFKDITDTLRLFDINKSIRDALVIAKNEYNTIATLDLQLGEIPQVFCNPSQINQVVLNLLVNSAHAIKSQKKSSPGKITIKTWPGDDCIFCSISDDGPGIPEAIRDKIFSPFFTTKKPGEGTGLGLSISYDIITNKHQGSISVDCPPEGGTIFTLSLPLKPNRSNASVFSEDSVD